MKRRVIVGAALSLVTFLASRSASAAEPVTSRRSIVLVSDERDPMATRVTAELEALGFEVILSPAAPMPAAPTRDSDPDLDRLPPSDAAAVVAIDAHGDVRVWTPSNGPARFVLRAAIEHGSDPAVVALRAVEALRTATNDAASPRAPAEDPATTPPRSEAPPGPLERRAPLSHGGASVALSIAGNLGETTPSWQAVVLGHWMWTSRWGVEASGALPLSAMRWSASEGSADVSFGIGAAALRSEWLASNRQVADVALGGAIAFVHVVGSPGAGFVGVTSTHVVAGAYARLGYAVVVAPWLRVRADAAGFIAPQRLVIRFAGRDEGAWGQPVVSGSLGVEVVSR